MPMPAPNHPLASRYQYQTGLRSTDGLLRWLVLDTQTGTERVAVALSKRYKTDLEQAVGVMHLHLAAVVDLVREPEPAAVPEPLDSDAVVALVEHVPGPTLYHRLRQTTVAPCEAVSWFLRLIDAVLSLHRRGSVHQAISPRSIVVEPQGRAVPPVLSQLLAPPVGSFCSPDQLRGAHPTPEDDVWSLHASLYAALTGAPPFSGKSQTELQESIARHAAPKLSEFGLDEPALQCLFDAGLTENRERRTIDLVLFRAALEAYERGEALPAVLTDASPRRPPDSPRPAQPADLIPNDAILFGSKTGEFDMPALIPRETPQTATARGAATAGEAEYANKAGGLAQAPPTFRSKKKQNSAALAAGLLVVAAAIGAAVFWAGRQDAGEIAVEVPATEEGRSEPTPKAKAPAPSMTLDECIASYFAEGTFIETPRFDFLCETTDLRRAASRLYKLVRTHDKAATATVPPNAERRAKSLGDAGLSASKNPPLGWYELAASAIIRTGCCNNPAPVELPKTKGPCPELQDVVQELADASAQPGDLSPHAAKFDEAVACLFSTKTRHPYAYRKPPEEAHHSAFQLFLTNAAVSDAKRSTAKRTY